MEYPRMAKGPNTSMRNQPIIQHTEEKQKQSNNLKRKGLDTVHCMATVKNQ